MDCIIKNDFLYKNWNICQIDFILIENFWIVWFVWIFWILILIDSNDLVTIGHSNFNNKTNQIHRSNRVEMFIIYLIVRNYLDDSLSFK